LLQVKVPFLIVQVYGASATIAPNYGQVGSLNVNIKRHLSTL